MDTPNYIQLNKALTDFIRGEDLIDCAHSAGISQLEFEECIRGYITHMQIAADPSYYVMDYTIKLERLHQPLTKKRKNKKK